MAEWVKRNLKIQNTNIPKPLPIANIFQKFVQGTTTKRLKNLYPTHSNRPVV